MKKHRAYAVRNVFGYWVGCIEYPDGMKAQVTNAKSSESAAREIAERMIEKRNKCSHNAMVPNNDPNYVWRCADCGYVFGKTRGQA